MDTDPPVPLIEPERKKILYVITKAVWGGAQRYVYDLATTARKADYDVVVAFGTDGPLGERLAASGIRTITIPGLGRNISWKEEVTAFKSIYALLKAERPDTIHVNSSKAGLTLLAARIARVPHIIFTAHGFAFNENRPLWQRLVLHLIYALTVYLSHTTICVSRAIRNDIGWVPFAGKKLVVIRNGIDAPHQKTKSDARAYLLPEHTEKTWLGMVAELHPIKRIEDAIEAVSLLTENHPETILVVLGEGEHRTHLEEVIKRFNVSDRVFLKGFMDDAASYMSAFDIFLMPSRSEALAYAVIEAGYAGVPVIASRVGGIPEVVTHKETGLLVPAENPHALYRAIRNLLDDPALRATLGKNLAASVSKHFSKERMLAETLTLYGRTNH